MGYDGTHHCAVGEKRAAEEPVEKEARCVAVL